MKLLNASIILNETPSISKFILPNALCVLIPQYSFNRVEVTNENNNSNISIIPYIHNYSNIISTVISRKYYTVIYNNALSSTIPIKSLTSITPIKFSHIKKLGKIFEYPFDIERGIEVVIIYKSGKVGILRDSCTYPDFSAQFLGIFVSGISLCILFKVVL